VKAEINEVLLLDEHLECSYVEFLQLSGLTEEELSTLLECGALIPVNPDTRTFSGKSLVIARAACRLRNDLDLDPHALAVALRLLDRIEELEAELHQKSAQLLRQRY
jgi:chaperone modulatory protein CbpM